MVGHTRRIFRPMLMSAAESVQDIHDGATIAAGGFGSCGFPFELFDAINATKAKNLTVIGATMGGVDSGFGPLARDGQLKKAITTYVGENPLFTKHLFHGEFEVEFCPMGTLVDRLRAAGAGLPAFYTPTGYGTAVSEGRLPVRFAPGKSVRVAEYSHPRETRQFNGRWCTLEMALPADFAFVRAWKADKRGNLVFRGTTQNFNLASAKAAKVCIAEVEEIVECGELDPKTVHLPGVYVQRLVCPPNIKRVAELVVERKPGSSTGTGKNAHASRNLIARRAALEIKDGMTLNLGIGIPNMVASYIPPDVDVVLQGENGLLGIGPYPLPEEVDPDITNAGKQTVTMSKSGASLFDSAESFSMIRGGHLDLTMLGALEVSGTGDIASWWVPGKVLKGMGGAMDLVVCGCKKIVLMEHTDKEGKSRIVERCKAPVTGRECLDMIITNLAVFVVEKAAGGVGSLVLTEVAEGVTLEEVKAKTEAHFAVSADLRTMSLAAFPSQA